MNSSGNLAKRMEYLGEIPLRIRLEALTVHPAVIGYLSLGRFKAAKGGLGLSCAIAQT